MKTPVLKAEKRAKSKVKTIRRENKIPAIICGKVFGNEDIAMDYQEFRRTYERAGESVIIEIELGDKKIPVLVNEIQYDPVTDQFIHVDFRAIDMNQEIHANIPVHLEGIAPAVKLLSGILHQAKEAIEIKCLPKDLISSVTVDISGLVDFHTTITVGDVVFPKGIVVLDDPDVMIVSITAPKIAEEKEDGDEEEVVEGEEKEGEATEEEEKEGEKKE